VRLHRYYPQPSAELAPGLTWATVGTGQASATINEHVLAYRRTPILWTRARAAHSPLGGLGADQWRPLAQTGLGWRAAATRLRSGGDDTFDGRVASM
jgi:hypothetical protein